MPNLRLPNLANVSRHPFDFLCITRLILIYSKGREQSIFFATVTPYHPAACLGSKRNVWREWNPCFAPSWHRGQSSRVRLTPPSWPTSTTSNSVKLLEIYCKFESLTRTEEAKNPPPSPALPQVPRLLLLLAMSNLTTLLASPRSLRWASIWFLGETSDKSNIDSRPMLLESQCFSISTSYHGKRNKRNAESPHKFSPNSRKLWNGRQLLDSFQ